jgi:hypothetical protein
MGVRSLNFTEQSNRFMIAPIKCALFEMATCVSERIFCDVKAADVTDKSSVNAAAIPTLLVSRCCGSCAIGFKAWSVSAVQL